jgi:GH35 family endo-1,4-beta-xylanase
LIHQPPGAGLAQANSESLVDQPPNQVQSPQREFKLKWEKVHPDPGRYDFDLPDKYVAFGEKSHMFIVGHTLVWHHQTPKWVFEDAKGNPGERDTLLARMADELAERRKKYAS